MHAPQTPRFWFTPINCVIITVCLLTGCSGNKIDYFGQKHPETKAEKFADGILSTDANEHSPLAFAPDGSRVLWAVMTRNYRGKLMEMKFENGKWSPVARPSFADSTSDEYSPSFTPDGKTLMFGSRRTAPQGYKSGSGNRIWLVDLTENGWGDPRPLDTLVSTAQEFGHTVSGNGNIYIVRMGQHTSGNILKSSLGPNGYTTPSLLPFNINSVGYEDGPYISPEEDYLIFESTRPDGIGGSHDLYITFQAEKGGWTIPVNMGPTVNTRGMERFPRVSPDGKYLFFASNIDQTKEKPGFDYYWVDAKVISDLKKQPSAMLDESVGGALISSLEEANTDRATELLSQLLSSNKNNLDAVLVYSSSLRSQAKYDEAEQLISNIPIEARSKTAVNMELALIKFGLDKDNEGKEILDTLLIPEDQQWPTYNYLSNQLFALGEYPLSDEYLDQVIAIGPNPVMYYNRGCGYAKLGETQRAFASLDKAIALGYQSREQYVTDPDLESLKKDKQWKVLVGKLR